MIAFLFFFTVFYFGLGIMWSVMEVRQTTGRDTFPNLWKHRKFALKQMVCWAYYAIRVFKN